MTVFADYNFYANKYLMGRKAAVSAADFSTFARKATQKIKLYTGNNVDENNIPECVQMCCCEIAELFCKEVKFTENNQGVASESVQGWSKSYESTESRNQATDKAIKNIVYEWLSGTGLLYRGIKPQRRLGQCL